MKKAKILGIILTCLMVLMSVTCFAEEPASGFSGITGDGYTPSTGTGSIVSTADKIIGFIRWIGYAIAVGMLVFIGIKYVMASANEKADLKNSLIRYVIGAALIAGAVTIAGWIFSAVEV